MFNAHAKELSLDINISVNYNIHVQKQNTSFGRGDTIRWSAGCVVKVQPNAIDMPCDTKA